VRSLQPNLVCSLYFSEKSHGASFIPSANMRAAGAKAKGCEGVMAASAPLAAAARFF
jgi:hypothetical protein